MRQNVNGLFNREELKTLVAPIPPLDAQREIVTQIEKEQELVNANKQLIEIFEQKIKDRIGKVWGTSTSSVQETSTGSVQGDEKLAMVAEEGGEYGARK